jgi:DNA-binding transcriptional MocR family regulator
MTIWRPRLSGLNGPVYQQVADAIHRDIQSGTLEPGDRLPPQRDLADVLGLTVGTVTRAYQIATRRGLIAGEVGRGTFVQPLPGESPHDLLDLSLNALPPHAHISELAARLDPPMPSRASLLDYPPRGGRLDHRETGAAWIARRGVDVAASQVLVTVGAQHALFAAIASVASAGDAILVEELTFSGVLSAARMLGLRPVAVAIDSEGLRPDSLEASARASGARALVVQPALHNPTGVTMSDERRRAVVETISRLGLAVVEDDTYGFLVPEAQPMTPSLEGGTWAYVTGLSKSVAAGYRTGFLATSPSLGDRASATLWATAVAASPISVAVAAAIVADGTADRIVEWKRAEVRARGALARQILRGVPDAISPASPHLWLPLPRPWRAGTLAAAARARGMLIGTSEAFVAQAGATPRAIRVCLMPPRSRERLTSALETLRDLLASEPSAESTI